MLTFDCPACSQSHNMRESSLATLYRCRGCGARLRFREVEADKPSFLACHLLYGVLALLSLALGWVHLVLAVLAVLAVFVLWFAHFGVHLFSSPPTEYEVRRVR